jgi:quinolinate synthase
MAILFSAGQVNYSWSTRPTEQYGMSVMLHPECRFFTVSKPEEVSSSSVLVQKIHLHCFVKSITARKAGIIKVSFNKYQ